MIILRAFLLLALLACISLRDARTRRIPNRLTLGLLAVDWLFVGLSSDGLADLACRILPLLACGLLCLGALLALSAIVERACGSPSFGGGDVKLMAAFAAMECAPPLWAILLLASAMALLYSRIRGLGLKDAIPFAPFLGAGFILAVLLEPLLV